jgi:short-subunit dehydrogenase
MIHNTSQGVALVTGASSGIGAVYADRLARRGHDLLLVARDGKRLEQLAAHIRQQTGRKAETLVADLTDRADARKVAARIAQDDSISLLVNNAGVGATASMVDSDPDSLEAMIELNVTALTRLSHAAAVRFAAVGKGAIINIASIVAVAPSLLNGTYSGTKAFVVNLTQSLHAELGGKGVRLQAVLPGATRTDFWNVAGTPVEHLPQQIVMSAEEMVDASLVGFDRGELITIPSLPDARDWEALDAARAKLGPNLSHAHPAARYGVVAKAA